MELQRKKFNDELSKKKGIRHFRREALGSKKGSFLSSKSRVFDRMMTMSNDDRLPLMIREMNECCAWNAQR